jgi:hypothetical protein
MRQAEASLINPSATRSQTAIGTAPTYPEGRNSESHWHIVYTIPAHDDPIVSCVSIGTDSSLKGQDRAHPPHDAFRAYGRPNDHISGLTHKAPCRENNRHGLRKACLWTPYKGLPQHGD